MTDASLRQSSAISHQRGLVFVFLAGVFWSTIGLGVRLIEEATVWQILLYRSISLSAFLYVVIRLRTGASPFAFLRHAGPAAVIGGLALVAAYSGGIYAIQATSVANAMLLFASAPFLAAVLGWLVLRRAPQGTRCQPDHAHPYRRQTFSRLGAAGSGPGAVAAGETGSSIRPPQCRRRVEQAA